MAITLGNTTSSGTQINANTSFSFSHTTHADTDLLNITIVAQDTVTSDRNVTGVTFNGVAATEVVAIETGSTNMTVEIWRLTETSYGTNLGGVTANVQVTFAGKTSTSVAWSTDLIGVNQTTPVQNSNTAYGTSSTPSVTVSGAVAGSMTIGGLGTAQGDSTLVSVTTGTQLAEEDAGPVVFAAAYNSGNGTLAWYITSSFQWHIAAANYNEAATGGSGSVTADAIIEKSISQSVSSDSVIEKSVQQSVSSDAIVMVSESGLVSADSTIKSQQQQSVSADSAILRSFSQSVTVDAVVESRVEASFTADAYIYAEAVTWYYWSEIWSNPVSTAYSVTADAVILRQVSDSIIADAIVKKTISGSVTADSTIKKAVEQSIAGDAVVKKSNSQSATVDATIRVLTEQSVVADATIESSVTQSVNADAIVLRAISQSMIADSIVKSSAEQSVSADAYILSQATEDSITADAIIKTSVSQSISANAYIFGTTVQDITADAVIKKGASQSVTADAVVESAVSQSISADAVIQATVEQSISADAVIEKSISQSISADATILVYNEQSVVADAVVERSVDSSVTADAIVESTVSQSITSNAVVETTVESSIAVDAVIERSWQQSVTLDATIVCVGTPVWVSPPDTSASGTLPVFVFEIPESVGGMHFKLELDKVNTFDGPDYRLIETWISTTGWEYHDGVGWQPFPSSGVSNVYSGNECRYTVQVELTSGVWYRKITGGVA